MKHQLTAKLCAIQLWLFAIPLAAWTFSSPIRRPQRKSSGSLRKASVDSTTIPTTTNDGAPFVRRYDRFRVDLDRVERIVPENAVEFDSDAEVRDSPVAAVAQFWKKASQAIQLSSKNKNVNSDQIQREAAKMFPTISSNNMHILSSHNPTASPNGSYDFPTCWVMTQLWQETDRLIRQSLATTSKNDSDLLLIIADPQMTPIAINFANILEWIVNLPSDEQNEDTDYLSGLKIVEFTTLPVGQQAVPIIRLQKDTQTGAESLSDHNSNESSNDTDFAETTINSRTRSWVQRLLVQRGICPFTKHADKSGQGLKAQRVPVGRIAYHASDTHNLISLLAETWKAMYEMLLAGEEGISSILLAAPRFDGDFGFWAGPVFACLEASVVAAQAEAWLGVVCFHPSYQVNDGSSWPGFGHLHSVPRLEQWVNDKCTEAQQQETALASQRTQPRPRNQSTLNTDFLSTLSTDEIAAGGAWQRRTPHATINVLRANQLAKAETVRDSSTLYPRNIQVLMALGNEQLQADLQREQGLQ